jgi:hypothetical protein
MLADASVKSFQWLEQLSWGANLVLASAALAALWQVGAAIKQARCALEQNRIALEQLKLAASQLEISRADIILRSRREAISVALEQCERFAETILPHFDVLTRELLAKNYKLATNVDPDFPFIKKEADPQGAEIWASDADRQVRIVRALNELESFAMYFASDLADESVAFTPAAGSFCQICEYYRLFIGVYRQPEKMRLYQNLVKLYGMWKPRLERTVLEEQSKLIETKKQKLPSDKRGTPLGTNL